MQFTKFIHLNSKVNLWEGLIDLPPTTDAIKMVLNNLPTFLRTGPECGTEEVAYESMCEEVDVAKLFISEHGVDGFFLFCQEKMNEYSDIINELLKQS